MVSDEFDCMANDFTAAVVIVANVKPCLIWQCKTNEAGAQVPSRIEWFSSIPPFRLNQNNRINSGDRTFFSF